MKKKIGWVLTILIGALLLFSAFGKFTATPEMIEQMEKGGTSSTLLIPLAILEATVAILFLIPQTSFFGVILVTGYMGGAILTHLRMGDVFYIQTLIPIVAWIGYSLRNYEGVMRLIRLKDQN